MQTTEYSSTYNYAFPIKVTTPIPSDGVSGSNTAFTTTMVYDPTTGLPISTTDANGQTTAIEYDAYLRPTKTIAPNGQQTITEYGLGTTEATRFTKVRTQIDATNWKEAYSWYDGLGRTYKTQSVDSNGDVFTETEFDAVGRPKRSTNPYRANEAKVWTTTNYDVQGRPFEVLTENGAKVTTAFGLSTTGTNIGTTVTVTDQANKQRRSITNALGQLTRVDEPNNAGQLDVNGVPAQPTNYTYDTLNNLITVNQGVQTRSFAYNSLSRLKSANNPESGLINYVYDNNGNLASKTDARSITTSYVYDVLNRVKNRNYSDNTTPNVAYTYDNGTNAKGKLTKVANGLSETRYLAFDIFGRVTSSQQMTDNVTYNPQSYVYNLSGALIEEVYPSGRVVRNTLDIDGDLAQVQSRKSNDTFRNYANAFTYTSAGAVSSLRLGNGKFENTTFNSRLQPIQIGLGSSATSQNLLKLNFDYGLADNNGNVKSQTITTPTIGNVAGFTATQTYSYDSLNRIKQATEVVTNQPTQGWQQTFVYDRYGNRTFDEANTTTLPKNCGTAPNKIVCAADVAKFNPSANVNDNKLVGTNYDNVGNTKVDANGQTFIYDAENKQVQVNNANGIVGKYWYNGDGQRVKKYVPSTQETTIFVYDATNKLVAEYSTVTASQSEAKVSYLTNDHLGSPRITTDSLGKVVSRRDFMPFGEEITRAGNSTDSVRQKFTGYERDSETGLDYAKARMFGSELGRFTSPDDFLNDTVVSQPASWNLYVYTRNNPLSITDPTGEKIYAGDITNSEDRIEYLRRVNATYGCSACVTIDSSGFLQVDTTGLSTEILNATAFFTEAINSTDLMFQAVVSNNDPDVEFGKSSENRGSVPRFGPDGTEIKDPKTGKPLRRTATLIKLDFADDKNFVGGSDADKASFLDLVFAHEVSHFSPSFKRDPTTEGQRGPVDNPINEIRLLLGMPLRAAYLTRNLGSLKVLRFGEAVKDVNGNVVRGVDGIEVDGSRIIIWINKQKR